MGVITTIILIIAALIVITIGHALVQIYWAVQNALVLNVGQLTRDVANRSVSVNALNAK